MFSVQRGASVCVCVYVCVCMCVCACVLRKQTHTQTHWDIYFHCVAAKHIKFLTRSWIKHTNTTAEKQQEIDYKTKGLFWKVATRVELLLLKCWICCCPRACSWLFFFGCGQVRTRSKFYTQNKIPHWKLRTQEISGISSLCIWLSSWVRKRQFSPEKARVRMPLLP